MYGLYCLKGYWLNVKMSGKLNGWLSSHTGSELHSVGQVSSSVLTSEKVHSSEKPAKIPAQHLPC